MQPFKELLRHGLEIRGYFWPWLVWLHGLNTSLQTEGLPV